MYIQFSDLPLCKDTHLSFEEGVSLEEKEEKASPSVKQVWLQGPLGRITYDISDIEEIQFTSSGMYMPESSPNAPDHLYLLCDRFVQDSSQVGSAFQVGLKLQGTGFKVTGLSPTSLQFSVGLSHPIEFFLPEDVSYVLVNPTQVFLFGMNKEKVSHVAAQCCALLPKDNYHGRGIHRLEDLASLKLKKGKKK